MADVPLWIAEEAIERAAAGVPFEDVAMFVRRWARLAPLIEKAEQN